MLLRFLLNLCHRPSGGKMACSAVRSPFLRKAAARHYATAAAVKPKSSAKLDVQVLDNKVTVATAENNNPLTQVSIIFKAGSRNETYDTQGITHLLRVAAGLSTQRSSYFGITNNIQQLGANIIATTDRESIAYTLQVTRDNLSSSLKFLEDVATQQEFRPWEINDQLPRLRYELSMIPEATRVLELLHKAAYHTGLGYSLYSPKRQLGKIHNESLQHFVNTWCTAPKCAVVATGTNLCEINAFAKNLNLKTNNCDQERSKYRGGEIRKERTSELASVAVALETVGMDKENEALAFAVLQRAAGTGSKVKWGGSISPLSREASNAAGQEPFAISAFNATYTDTGLFGFVLRAEPSVAGAITKAAYKWIKSPKVSDADITRGKNTLKAEILSTEDNSESLLEIIAQQALYKDRICPPSALAAEVDKITAADVERVAKQLSKGKPSMAAIGNLCSVPRIDELC